MSQQGQSFSLMADTTAPAEKPAETPTAPAQGSSALPEKPAEKQTEPAPEKKPADSLINGDVEAPEEKKADPVELKLPEGFRADDAQLAAIKQAFGDVGLDSPKAQKLFDTYLGFEAARAKAAEEAFGQQSASWLAEVRADKELGGERFQQTVADLGRAQKYLGADFGKVLAESGLGNHPVLVRALVKLGRAQREDTVAGGKSDAPPPPERLSTDSILFPPTPPPQGK